MIISRYSKTIYENAKRLREINDAINQSRWRRKFAFTLTQITVPGHDSIQVSNFALFRTYYTRTVYEINEVYSHRLSLSKKLIKRIPNKDAVSYFSVQYDLAHQDNESRRVDLSQCMLATEEPMLVVRYFDSDKIKRAKRVYRDLYKPLAGTKLAKGLMPPDKFDKLRIVTE